MSARRGADPRGSRLAGGQGRAVGAPGPDFRRSSGLRPAGEAGAPALFGGV